MKKPSINQVMDKILSCCQQCKVKTPNGSVLSDFAGALVVDLLNMNALNVEEVKTYFLYFKGDELVKVTDNKNKLVFGKSGATWTELKTAREIIQ